MAGFLVAVAMFEAATLFILLGNTADEALGPPLAQFSDELNLPPRFAGVTLLALGNGAADISATVAAVRANDWKLSLGALTGAGAQTRLRTCHPQSPVSSCRKKSE